MRTIYCRILKIPEYSGLLIKREDSKSLNILKFNWQVLPIFIETSYLAIQKQITDTETIE